MPRMKKVVKMDQKNTKSSWKETVPFTWDAFNSKLRTSSLTEVRELIEYLESLDGVPKSYLSRAYARYRRLEGQNE